MLSSVLFFVCTLVASSSGWCIYHDRIFYAGYFQPSPCVQCKCEMDTRVHCTSPNCQVLADNCLKSKVKGCCDECVQFGCVHNGKVYEPGERTNFDQCEHCVCRDTGLVQCTRVSCNPERCLDEHQVDITDKCCPECKDYRRSLVRKMEEQTFKTLKSSPRRFGIV